MTSLARRKFWAAPPGPSGSGCTAPAVGSPALSVSRPLAGPTYTIDAFLTVRPQARPGDAVAVLRRLAARAAAQPMPVFGPVEYSSNREWTYYGGDARRNLNYLSRHSVTHQAWDALSGATAVRIVLNFNGKVLTSYYPAPKTGQRGGAWINPVTLPVSPSALRKHLLAPLASGMQESHGRFGLLSWQVVFVSVALQFMSGEPLPPAVHSAMLEVLAQIADHPGGHGITYVDMGTAIDRLGRTGVVIGQEQANSGCSRCVGVSSMVFDPRTGALLDVANAQCEIPLGTIPKATGQCYPTDYTEFNAPRSVSALPHYRAHHGWLFNQAGGPTRKPAPARRAAVPAAGLQPANDEAEETAGMTRHERIMPAGVCASRLAGHRRGDSLCWRA